MTKAAKSTRIKNEFRFKRVNNRIKDIFENMFSRAEQIEFVCECSNKNCTESILVKISQYEAAHKDPLQFVVKRGHEQKDIEKIVKKQTDYTIVKKTLAA